MTILICNCKNSLENRFENEIFVLIGHNGSGKTTAISVLTGLLKATSGSGRIYNYDINKEMEKIRKMISVCQQNDPLFDDLTVKEHLVLYSRLKGVEENKIMDEVNEMLKEIDLVEKSNCRTLELSGGQKRKLCVGIAFIGGSKVVFLDEPTW